MGNQFIAVCSCGWRSPSQRTAGLAGALLDDHRSAVRDTSAPDDGASTPESADRESSDPAADNLAGRLR